MLLHTVLTGSKVNSHTAYMKNDACDCYLKIKSLKVLIIVAVCYTQWFDRSNPSGGRDNEALTELRAEYPGKICPKPLTIQAATLTGVPAESIGQVFLV